MADEELDSLFDYRRVQPKNFICLDDDELDDFQASSPKRRKVFNSKVEKVEKNGQTIHVLDCEEEEKENEDWLLPPPKVSRPSRVLAENSTIKELRLMKQELLSCAQSAEDVLRSMDESGKGEVGKSLQPSLDAVADQPSRPHTERAKIVISVQDKDGQKQFRIYIVYSSETVILICLCGMTSLSGSLNCMLIKLSLTHGVWYFALMARK